MDGGHMTMPQTVESPLDVRGLTVAYNGNVVLEDVDYTAPAGGMVGIIGPNGAGKSTFLKAALGLVVPVSGQAWFFGGPFRSARRRIAYVPQRASVDWDFPTSALGVVMMGFYGRLGLLGLVRRHDRLRALECLRRVGLEDFAARQIGQLSGGQQQRVFLARALAQDAQLIILDEPFAGVDAATERAIVSVLQSLKVEGRTVIAVHHDLATVPDYFTDVLILNRRRIAAGPVGTAFTPETLDVAYGGRLATARAG